MNAAMSVWAAFAWTLATIPMALVIALTTTWLVRRWERRRPGPGQGGRWTAR